MCTASPSGIKQATEVWRNWLARRSNNPKVSSSSLGISFFVQHFADGFDFFFPIRSETSSLPHWHRGYLRLWLWPDYLNIQHYANVMLFSTSKLIMNGFFLVTENLFHALRKLCWGFHSCSFIDALRCRRSRLG
jgi:hypothetical protein